MPDSASIPASWCSTAWATTSSQRLAGLDDEPAARALDPPGPDGDDVAVPAVVRSHHVRAATEQQERASGLVGLAHGGHEFVRVLDLDHPVDDAADAERGEVRQPDRA